MIFLSEPLKDGEPGPSCNVCGAIMSREPIPKRIQRRRTKDWKMPEGAVYVGRPTKWGNFYRVGRPLGVPGNCETREEAVALFRESLKNQIKHGWNEFHKIRGKDLACWCRLDQPCHADVLLEIANQNRPWLCLSCGASTGVR